MANTRIEKATKTSQNFKLPSSQANYAQVVNTSNLNAATAVTKPQTSKKPIFGASQSCALKASKNPQLPKAIFRVGNLDENCSVEEITSYLKSLNIRVINCFDLNSNAGKQIENKAFRVCIFAGDKSKFTDPLIWAFGMSVREWKFKAKIENGVPDTNKSNLTGKPSGSATTVVPKTAPSDSTSSATPTDVHHLHNMSVCGSSLVNKDSALPSNNDDE